MHPNAEQWDAFYTAFRRKSGLDLNHYKPEQMHRRIASMAEAKGCRSLDEFWTVLSAAPEEIRWFMDKLAINVSELFRNAEKWAELREKVLPELHASTKSLKVWSAGCSYGAEAYSMAITLDRWFPGQHRILGTDIDEAALRQAQSGLFSDNDLRGVPAELAKRYFKPEGKGWQADPNLRRYLTFKKGDLFTDRFDVNYDLILCRNVVIYFTDAAKEDLYQRFFRALKPGGILFVGSTERIFSSREIGFETPLPFFYRKPLGDIAWRNAS